MNKIRELTFQIYTTKSVFITKLKNSISINVEKMISSYKIKEYAKKFFIRDFL